MIDKEVAAYLYDLCIFHESDLLDQQEKTKSTVLQNAIDSELKVVRTVENILKRICDEVR